MLHMIEKLMTNPLVPAAMLVCWLVLELLALRRLRRERRQRASRSS